MVACGRNCDFEFQPFALVCQATDENINLLQNVGNCFREYYDLEDRTNEILL